MDMYCTNVPPIYFVTPAFLPLLQEATERQHGYSPTVINISSISSRAKTSQDRVAYNTSKAGRHPFDTHMLANEIAGNGLQGRVDSIAPSVFPGEMTAKDSGPGSEGRTPQGQA